MSPRKRIPVLQPVPVPKGTAEHEAARESILRDFAASIPDDLRLLSQDDLDATPKNVLSAPRQCGLLSPEELAITEDYDATALAEAIAARQLTAVQVATAFAKRALIAHQLTSCLSEWFLEEALERAAALDAHLAATGQTVGPLHGVPVSIKGHIPMAGHWSDGGFLSTRKRDDEDCQMVRILRDAGVVFYCKTNQPQAIMHLESTSYLGRVLNPYNTGLSAGGSTGGEAALVALRGSVLGVGTDIGGSVRGPAAFCGVYGFKATTYTFPTKGFVGRGLPTELNIMASAGPLCHSLRDMDLFTSAVLAAKPYLEDPRIVPIPWTGLSTPQSSTLPLKIGFMMHDGVITPQPPVTRALEWARSRLEEHPSRFETKTFEPYGTAEAMRNIRLAYYPTGVGGVQQALKDGGEPMYPLTEWILRDASARGPLSAAEVFELRCQRDQFRGEFAAHWADQDVDLVICPAFVGPACVHETAWYWNYTALWNYVDCPGVSVPTPIVAGKKGEEEYGPGEPLGEECRHVRELWAEGDFEGAPVNLQIVARKHHDNGLFAGVAALQDVLGLV
jgi:amidase